MCWSPPDPPEAGGLRFEGFRAEDEGGDGDRRVEDVEGDDVGAAVREEDVYVVDALAPAGAAFSAASAADTGGTAGA